MTAEKNQRQPAGKIFLEMLDSNELRCEDRGDSGSIFSFFNGTARGQRGRHVRRRDERFAYWPCAAA